MDTFWQELLALILTPTLIVAGVAWLLKSYVDHAATRSLEQFKKQLEHESFEQRTRFSILHEQRAEIIADLYKRLVKTQRMITDLVHPVQYGDRPLADKRRDVVDAYNETASFFFENKLFLHTETAEKVEALIAALRKALVEFDSVQTGEDYQPDDTGVWIQTWKDVADEIPPLLAELEARFQRILGLVEIAP